MNSNWPPPPSLGPDLGLGRAGPDLLAALADPALLAGIAAYRRHPYQRRLADPPVVWEEGGSRLLDFGTAPGGPTVLFVPSLINRAYVLDLAEGRSAMRHLAGQGVRPLLLDWGWPGEDERQFSLTDYIAGRLERAMAAAASAGPVVLAGYCMGGLLTLAAAQRRPDLVRGLALLATPWDFHAGIDPQVLRSLPRMRDLLASARLTGALSVDALQAMFSLLDPGGIAAKYRGFARQDQDSKRAQMFVALEDWLNDGVPLAAPVAEECFSGWYGRNTPMRGTWKVAGQAVEPTRLRLPCLVAVPGRDRIVPPESARPLAALIPGARMLEPAAGHIGMAAGSASDAVLWRPMLDWLGTL